MAVIGKPAASLADASFATSREAAAMGAVGETLTAKNLDPLCQGPASPTIIHDVSIPGVKANIDHLLISGSDVIIVDSKMWKPGLYWTLWGKTRRGLQSVPHADKGTYELLYNKLSATISPYLASIYRPQVIVYSSQRDVGVNLRFYRPRMADASTVDVFIRRFFTHPRPADPLLVKEVLNRLVVASG